MKSIEENIIETLSDKSLVKWFIDFGESLNPEPKAAYKKLLIAYFEYLIAMLKDKAVTEAQQEQDV